MELNVVFEKKKKNTPKSHEYRKMHLPFILLLFVSYTRGYTFRHVLSGAMGVIRGVPTDWSGITHKYIPEMALPIDECDAFPPFDSISKLKRHYMVGTDVYIPYYYFDSNSTQNTSQLVGLTINMLEKAFSVMNAHYQCDPPFTYEYFLQNNQKDPNSKLGWFDYIVAMFDNNTIDFHDCTDKTEPRMKQASFSCAYTTSSHGLLFRKGLSPSSMAEINRPEIKIVVPKGYSSADKANIFFTDAVLVPEVAGDEPPAWSVGDFVESINSATYDVLCHPYYSMTKHFEDDSECCPGCTLRKLDFFLFKTTTDQMTAFVFPFEPPGANIGLIVGIAGGGIAVVVLLLFVVIGSAVLVTVITLARKKKKGEEVDMKNKDMATIRKHLADSSSKKNKTVKLTHAQLLSLLSEREDGEKRDDVSTISESLFLEDVKIDATIQSVIEDLQKNNSIIDKSKVTTGKLISSGSFGSVLRGEFKVGAAILEVAVKAIPLSNASIEEIQKEVSIMTQIRCKYVLQCYGCYFDEDMAFIVLEYCDSGDLYKFKFRARYKLKMMMLGQIARGMKFLHDQDIVHRDLKTQNILIHSKKMIKICDFGTSKRVSSSISKTLCGTPEYLAPEALTKTEVEKSKLLDIYSFGIIIWELFSEQTPFKKELENVKTNQLEMLTHLKDILVQGVRPDVKEVKGKVPDEIIEMMTSCWATNPEERPQSFDEIVETIRDVMKTKKNPEEEIESRALAGVDVTSVRPAEE